MLFWVFGEVQELKIYSSRPDKCSGFLELKHVWVNWSLSLEANDLPAEVRTKG